MAPLALELARWPADLRPAAVDVEPADRSLLGVV